MPTHNSHVETTSVQTDSRIVSARTLAARLLPKAVPSVVFAGLLWLATAAGTIPIPGSPVPITLQTFVVMLAALTLDWRQAAGAVVLYLSMGAAGLPVFANGGSTLSLVGPSAGFLFGFLPAVLVTAALKGRRPAAQSGQSVQSGQSIQSVQSGRALRTVLTVTRYLVAAIAGCIVVDYVFGILVQAWLTRLPLTTVFAASMTFVPGDLLKAVIASLSAAGILKLTRR
ncbi:biotin transporter BioY [Bifidobacterium choloepi]|uniref:Biotin transporter n=1 Tax=Bifidobacterium choloepi TaxID=2614131 RepID=A0A6I5NED1_9BIFI|nr:biotin transporter BioY [Bifidobacterium choloepi]NEG69714.1 biotin transporter BioY [Bifidobacterium choloepi]